MPNNTTLEQDQTPSMPERGENFADILSQYEQSHTHKPEAGQGLTGTVVAISPDQVFIDIGQKIEGVMPVADFRDPAGKVSVQVGDQFPVSIKGRNEEGYYDLSKVRVERPKDWTSLEAAFAEKRAIAGVVSGVVKGGVSVDVGVRAFMPASRSGAKDVPEMEKLVGQEITCRIIKLDVADEDVVVDRRVVLEEEEVRTRAKLFTDLQEGAVMHGTVRSLTEYGAFVDIGGVDGLLHVADIAWGHINKPSDALSVGQEVDVKILKVDPAKRRIALGLKQLLPHPWEQVGEKYKTGDRVHGAITRVTDFGAFVELEPGVEGLIHLSEMSWSKKARKPSDVVKPGDAVEAVVLHVSTGERRISLGLKQALGDPWADAQQKYPAGGVVEGPVVSLTKFGAFVQIAEGVEGMIHVGDITAEKRINQPQDVLRTGQTVRAQILEVDTERRRIRLGMKQLQPTSIDEYIAEHKEGDVVTGRIADVSGGRARVELGEGIQVPCKAVGAETAAVEEQAAGAGADVTSLSSMLSAKWKGGGAGSGPRATKREPARAGQIRSFRIVKLDAGVKKIEIELAG
ncbi:MAG TPA: 30S ribosomal protein S1 [Bryobacteraceae bacterium]|nr:30S ribosomal protein S1 [Bryobacteraceae bacterium]